MKELARELGMGDIPRQFDFDLTKFAHSANESALIMRRLSKNEIRQLIDLFKLMRKQLNKRMKHTSDLRTNSSRKRAGFKKNKPKYNWGKKRRARMGWKV